MPRTRKKTGHVAWYLPGRKRPVAHSVRAVGDYVDFLSHKHETVTDVQGAVVFDPEAIRILQVYVDAGFGGMRALDLFW